MNRALLAGVLVVLAGCPGPEDANPDRVWLVLDQVETRVKLSELEPQVPF